MFDITKAKIKVQTISLLKLKKELFKEDSTIMRLVKNLKDWLDKYHFIIIYIIILISFMKLFLLIFSKEPDFQSIVSYGERGTILISTLAILTFTYALCLEYAERYSVIKSGKYFLKSVLNFALGIIFSIGFRDSVINPTNIFGLPTIIFVFTIIIIYIFFFSGLSMLLLSAYFLVIGLRDLSKSLQNKTYSEDLD